MVYIVEEIVNIQFQSSVKTFARPLIHQSANGFGGTLAWPVAITVAKKEIFTFWLNQESDTLLDNLVSDSQ